MKKPKDPFSYETGKEPYDFTGPTVILIILSAGILISSTLYKERRSRGVLDEMPAMRLSDESFEQPVEITEASDLQKTPVRSVQETVYDLRDVRANDLPRCGPSPERSDYMARTYSGEKE